MKVKIGILLVVAALAVVAAGSARADAAPAGDSTTYIQCGDGTLWVLDSTWDVASFGDEICGGDYAVVDPSAADDSSDTSDDSSDAPNYGGQDVGLGAAANINPDPASYITEVQCSDGSVWAVASGDNFFCPSK